MKKSAFTIIALFLSLFLLTTACKEEAPAEPCDGKGVLNVQNKLDSTISVKIMETHNTVSIKKDYSLPFTLSGNKPYTLTIDGPKYHKDTTFMILFCDNKLFIVTR
jgi:hypothetical protein